jgi:hypothetical protein
MSKSSTFGRNGSPNYIAIRNEALPPVHEVVAEHRRMLREIAEAQDAQETSFMRTLYSWGQKELAALREGR